MTIKNIQIHNQRKPKYNSVTLYDHDHPNQKEIASFFSFKEATHYIQNHNMFIAFLDDQPETQHQRWGMRYWNS